VQHFLETANARHSRHVGEIAPELLPALQSYSWPGNIRELANVVERMVILKRSGRLELADLPPQFRAHHPTQPAAVAPAQASRALPESGIDLRQAVADYEESLIDQALSRTGGNRNAAAQLLGLNRTTLVEKLKRKRTDEQ
jgi:DNA-binding NtrC family response regulator